MTIPAKRIVQVNPGVVNSGGNPLALNGLFLTQNPLMPTKKVFGFVSSDAVKNFFGPASDEYALSLIYFAGYDNSPSKPGTMLFAPYNNAARAAWLQSGSLAGMSLAQLQALSAGVITVTVDGVVKATSSVDLSAATSFSDAASIIEAAFTSGPNVTWDAVQSAFIFESTTTGISSTISFAVTAALATSLKLTAATGATLSQGDTIDTPSSAMDKVVAVAQNWASFLTLWEPDLAGKEAFAAWNIAQDSRWAYLAWDTDAQAIVQNSTTCFGAIAKANNYDGSVAISGDVAVATANQIRAIAAFIAGAIASIDFSRTNARITFAFRSSGLVVPTVEDDQLSQNLLGNGYSFYGTYATANQGFKFFYNGQLAGKWLWLDSYVNQIWMNSQFQLALMELVTAVGSIPYNEAGYNLVRAALADPINQALNFGAIRTGVALSSAESSQVNQSAGRDVTDILESLGFYLQILDPGTQARVLRQTPVVNFWYTDGQAIQQIVMTSVDVL